MTIKELLGKYQQDETTLFTHSISEFEMTIDGRAYTKRQEAFDEIHAKFVLCPVDHHGNGTVDVGCFRGLDVQIEKSVTQHQLVLKGAANYRVGFNEETGIGNITRLMNLPDRVEELVRMTKEEIDNTQQQLSSAEKEIEKPFARQEELDKGLKRQRELTKAIELDTLRKDNKVVVKEINRQEA